MFVKKFEAASLELALRAVRDELGPNALILSTQNVKGGWLQRPSVEVTAATENPTGHSQAPATPETIDLEEIFPHRREKANPAPVDGYTNRKPISKYADPEAGASAPGARKDSDNAYEAFFLRRGFSVENARELGRRLLYDYPKKDLAIPSFLDKARTKLILPHLSTLGDDVLLKGGQWVALGVAGSGKTSLMVKLALHLKALGKTVALVSADKRKLLGRKELSMYARLIRANFGADLDKLPTQEMVLIDSPSLPTTEAERWADLEKICENRSVLLVIDASTRFPEALRIVDRVTKRVTISAIAFSRVDLASDLGLIYDLAKATKLPILGASISQSFKTSFKFFEPSELANLILKGRGES